MKSVPHMRNLFALVLVLNGCLSVSSAQTADDIMGEKNRQSAYRKYISDIDLEISNPHFSPWRAKLISFKRDAQVSFMRYAAVGNRCASRVRPSNKECDWALIGESSLLSEMGAPGSLYDVGYKGDEAGTVRPQVEKWISKEFSEREAEVRHYANDPSLFESCISQASALKAEADISMKASDWNGALLSLRHSQLLMDDCSIRSKRQFESR